NLIPAFPLDGGKILHALIWRQTRDRNRATGVTGRLGQGFALVIGLWGLIGSASGASFNGLLALLLAYFLYQSASFAVTQGAIGRRMESLTVADVMDREPVT